MTRQHCGNREMTMNEFSQIQKQLINILKKQKPYKALLFGSFAHGRPHEDSDIDLLVVLNKNGMSKNYKEMLSNKKIISKQLRELRKLIPIDLLVYTKDEWRALKNYKSSFIRKIQKESVRLI